LIANRSVLTDTGTLRDRVKHVLFSRRYAGEPTKTVLNAIANLGSIAVFGGLLRDLSLDPPSPALSDIDLVIATDSPQLLGERLDSLHPTRNRYGGYKVSQGEWTFDIWPLGETWAFKNGLVPAGGFRDLIHTTFFNWDAIVFELLSETFYSLPNYFKDLNARLLEINLEATANPTGNAVRALRLLRSRRAHWGPHLAHYMHAFLMTALERGPANVPPKYAEYIARSDVRDVFRALREHISKDEWQVFSYSGDTS
jgi:hypothetical protein